MKVEDIIAVIEKTAPPGIAASWDASGVQVAASCSEIAALAVMLDPDPQSLRGAVEAGAGFILAHHPLSLTPRFPNVRDGYFDALSQLIRGNVWLYSAHTTLDANPDGPAFWLARALGLRDLRVLEAAAHARLAGAGPGEPSAAFGFGFTGALPEPAAYTDFCDVLAARLGKERWRVCGPMPRLVSRVACCPGAGGSLIPAALRAGADIFITGDIRHHAALDARTEGLRILDVGHFILEEEMMRLFAEQLAHELSIPVRFFAGQDPLAEERASQG
jgi:dinuclear metal center YbgI/SA1388 family protein